MSFFDSRNAEALGRRLKELRVAAKLTQREVSEKIGYSTPQFISNWERGISCPPIDALTSLAEIYGVSGVALIDLLFEAREHDLQAERRAALRQAKAS